MDGRRGVDVTLQHLPTSSLLAVALVHGCKQGSKLRCRHLIRPQETIALPFIHSNKHCERQDEIMAQSPKDAPSRQATGISAFSDDAVPETDPNSVR